jgi:hypothetical protein
MALTKTNLANIVEGILPVANGGTALTTLGTAGQVLTVNSGATALQYSTPATTAPGGSTTQVQYNNAGAFAGSANMTFNGTTLTVNDLTDSSLTAGRVVYAGTAGNLTNSTNLTFDGTNLFVGGYYSVNNVGYVRSSTGLLEFQGGSTATRFMDSSYSAELMRITQAGNVGIGTSSPLGILDVVKSGNQDMRIRSSTTGEANIRFQNTTTGTTSSDGLYAGIIGSDAYLYNYESANLIFGTSSAERMRIDSSGNVGIGTSSPAARFNVSTATAKATASTINSGVFSSSDATSSSDLLLAIRQGGSATQSARWTGIQSYENGYGVQNLVLQDLGGNVGIGTTSPSSYSSVAYKLVIGNNVGSTGLTIASGTGSGGNIFFSRGTTTTDAYDGYISYDQATRSMAFATNTGVERMRITSAGGVSFGATGTAYGTSGQVLTSAGNAPPTWGAVSGTAKAYGFINSSSGSSVLSNSFNVSSVTLTSTGQNTINWSTAFANAQYVIVATTNKGDSNNDMNAIVQTGVTGGSRAQSTTQAFLSNGYSNQFQNSQQVCFVVFSN